MNDRYRMNRWAAALAVALLAIGVGVVAYNVGVSHGLAQSGQAVGGVPYGPYPYGWYRPWGFGFFLFPFLFFAFWVLILRGLFWGGPWRRRWYYAGPHDIPAGLEEWHRRAHEKDDKMSAGDEDRSGRR